MLANLELGITLCKDYTLAIQKTGKAKMGTLSRAKASCTRLARETVALARESMGGNGILLENNVVRHFLDTESYYTYEGSYDINSLLSAKELTGGISAFI